MNTEDTIRVKMFALQIAQDVLDRKNKLTAEAWRLGHHKGSDDHIVTTDDVIKESEKILEFLFKNS